MLSVVFLGKINQEKCLFIWQEAPASGWKGVPVWVHGDLAAGNVIIKEGKLAGVIDLGMIGVGDPACDLVMTWTFLIKRVEQYLQRK